MPTAGEIIETALRTIGVLAAGEDLGGSEGDDALDTLNRMLNSWRNESLMAFSIDRAGPFSLVASTQSYTIGTSATFNVTRPVKIEKASLRYEPNGADLELPIDVITKDEWQEIVDKTLESTIPYKLYYQPDVANGTIWLWPIPSTATHTLILYVWNPLDALAGLTTDLTFPPGYEEAILYNLVLRLSPEYGKSPDPIVLELARESKANIKTINRRVVYLKVDPLLRSSQTGYNIRSNR